MTFSAFIAASSRDDNHFANSSWRSQRSVPIPTERRLSSRHLEFGAAALCSKRLFFFALERRAGVVFIHFARRFRFLEELQSNFGVLIIDLNPNSGAAEMRSGLGGQFLRDV